LSEEEVGFSPGQPWVGLSTVSRPKGWSPKKEMRETVAVLGFCVWGANGRAYFKGFQVVGHIGCAKNAGAVGAERVDYGEAKMLEFFAYKHVSRGHCKRRRRETAIAEGKKPLPTRGSGGAS